ncbi:MAG TPA: type II toxin-antitoxin system antitoxin SocA domain-containing protein [Nitrospirota bacterium]|nr:type II toxin-antitoxin system antitoxin SocA domain-containing protein [Nitrospirota bacterium]
MSIYRKIGHRVKELRETAGMSQDALAKELGLPRPAISQIESGARKVAADELMALSKLFHVLVDDLLTPGKEPEVHLPEVKAEKAAGPQMRISVPQKNLQKFKEVLLYILNKVGAKENIGETVIYKLLYFIDFDFYEKYEGQLVGATYIKNKYGPTPVEFVKIVEKMIKDGEIEKVRSEYFKLQQTKYLPRRKAELTKLSAAEIEVIDDVLNRLSDMNASQISAYSHSDIPWMSTKDGETIEYESVFYRTPPYSVRAYAEENG